MTAQFLTPLRDKFPLLNQSINGQPIIYLDNAATTQKPQTVIDAVSAFYQESNANVHRAAHSLSSKATATYESARICVQQFINAKIPQEIIWTSGTTESINLVAYSWGRSHLKAGDEIILSQAEHHANIVPWQQLEKELGVVIKVVNLTGSGVIDLAEYRVLLSDRTKLVAVSHVSNVVGKYNPIKQIIKLAKQVDAKVLIDAAQSITHTKIDVQQLNCDFLVFSAHKMFGPTGVGCLYAKREILDAMPPFKTGGEMIEKVSFISGTTFNVLPHKFETGTPNIAGVIGFKKAIEFMQENNLHQYDSELVEYGYHQLLTVDGLTMLVSEKPDIGVYAFNIDNQHQQDVASYLDSKGIAVRAGHHCAMPLMEYLGVTGCIRVSIASYNTKEEIDALVSSLKLLVGQLSDEQKHNVQTQDDDVAIISQLFAKTKSWDEKHRQIMLLGKSLPDMPTHMKVEQYLIQGCESAAWLAIELDQSNNVQISAYSPAKIIRGLMVIVLAAVNHKSPSYINTFDFHHYFDELGLLQHLSPSRGNGLLAIVEKIKLFVAEQ